MQPSRTKHANAAVICRLLALAMLLPFFGCPTSGPSDLLSTAGSDSVDQTDGTTPDDGTPTPDEPAPDDEPVSDGGTTIDPPITPPADDPPVVAGVGPISDAGSDQTVNGNAVVTLDGSGSQSTAGGDLSFNWTQFSGPSVTLDSTNTATTTFAAPASVATSIELDFELLVTENNLTASDTVRVTVIQATPGSITPDPCPGGCSDGLFCNGVETCIDGQCIDGAAPNCDDGITCTVDTCDEATDACINAAQDSRCDNGLFCDGAETCNAASGCVTGTAPCPGQLCDEPTDTCVDVDCLTDANCSDGLFCNGVETCVANVCVPGTPIVCDDGVACTADSCDENANVCVFVPDNGSCETGSNTPANFRIAVIGDLGVNANAAATLTLIRDEGAEMIVHLGDLGYGNESVPQSALDWEDQVNTILGPDYPYFAVIGNHDRQQWPVYQQLLRDRINRITGATCTGDDGVLASCRYQGLFIVMTGGGIFDATTWDPYVDHVRQQLTQDTSTWRICAWHKNKFEMQLSSRGEPFDDRLYEECRLGRAMILTGHEHSYHRTKTLSNTETITIDPAWPNPDELRVSAGSTFVVVSGVGGASLRNQDRCVTGDPTPYVYPYCDDTPSCVGSGCCSESCFEWAAVYTSDTPAEEGGPSVHGALFIDFHINGNPNAAQGYFKNINGDVIDTFTIVSEVP